jgi:hypothetical protein
MAAIHAVLVEVHDDPVLDDGVSPCITRIVVV